MKLTLLLLIFCLLLISCSKNEEAAFYIEGVSQAQIKLNGTWKLTTNPPEEFWKNTTLYEEWNEIQVPGECMMQGIAIKHDEPFVYKKQILVPDDFANKNIYLQFDGVYSYARVWVNGNKVGEHHGGFTRWKCDITPFIQAGKSACITVEVTDRADEISYASGYAKHQIGGILRDVYLLAYPDVFPETVTITTDLDNEYKNAALCVSSELNKKAPNTQIKLELSDINLRKVQLENSLIELNNSNTITITNTIQNPEKWDAEHPNLYNLKISLFDKGKLVWERTHKIGFREVEINGNKLTVNGKEVKLRGACRHDIHPLLGRVSTPEYELKDVLLAKESNMNFIRTSHYPPTENFLALCDEYGLYVEDETAVCFVGSHRTQEYYPGSSESDAAFTERYLSQLKELVKNHKNHPSVIMWSIGNENSFGTNFKASYDWVKAEDPTRPVIFSYPGNVPDSIKAYDILSMHYPGISGDMNQHGIKTKEFGFDKMPVIFDEWAHVACYCNFTVIEDPNIRSFWGQSLDKMWQKVFMVDGGLGGAIWGMIDETFMLPDTLPGFNEWWGKIDKNVIPAAYTGHTVGYGEWGIVDTWRRKKPEFWNAKKAYSPVKFMKTVFENYRKGDPVEIPVHNRFDHTNFNELTINWHYKKDTRTLKPGDLEPHSFGTLSLPIDDWERNEQISIEIFDSQNQMIDKYVLRQKLQKSAEKPNSRTEEINFNENGNILTVNIGKDIKMFFDKRTGLIQKIQKEKNSIDCTGPFLNLRTKGDQVIYSSHKIKDYGMNWTLTEFDCKQERETVNVFVKGDYEDLKNIEFRMVISPDGNFDISYSLADGPDEYIREIGIKFIFNENINALSWKRDTWWSYYPENHLSRKEGHIELYSQSPDYYREKPEKDWTENTKSFYYNGTENEQIKTELTNIARSTKENIREFNLLMNNYNLIKIVGNGDIGCRIAKKENKIILHVNNMWDYIDLSWGNYQHNIKPGKKFQKTVQLSLK